jgi:hypothetical protein
MASTIPVISREIDLTEFKGVQPGRSRRISVQPDNLSTYISSSSTSDVFFSIPSSRNSFIQTTATQLVFNVLANTKHVTDPVARLSNGSGSSVVQAMEVVIQNQQIENLLNYNVYAAMVEDLQPKERAATTGQILLGASSFKTGAAINSATSETDGVPIRCALTLYSAVLGSGAEQFMPMVDGIRVKLTLAPTNVALTLDNETNYTAADTKYKLSNIALQLEVMDFDSGTMSALVAQGGGILKQHGTAVNNYQATLQAATSNNILIPARFSSVKALLCGARLSTNISSPNLQNTTGARVLPQIKEYFFQVDGANVPSVPVLVAAGASSIFAGEALSEVMKVFGASNSVQFEAGFQKSEYQDVTGTDFQASFMLGLNFESQDSAGSALISGRDLNSSNVYLNLTHYANSVVAILDSFALYDIVVSYNMMDGSVSMSK